VKDRLKSEKLKVVQEVLLNKTNLKGSTTQDSGYLFNLNIYLTFKLTLFKVFYCFVELLQNILPTQKKQSIFSCYSQIALTLLSGSSFTQ
jgi:hypothetical protein